MRTRVTGITKETRTWQTKDGMKSQTWYRVRVEVERADGQREQRDQRTRTMREAEALLARWRTEKACGSLTPRSPATVGEIAAQWLDLARPRLRPKTAADYARTVDVIVEAFETTPVQKLTAMRVQQQYRAWAQAGMGARSIELCHLRLRQILDLAVTWRIIRENPASLVKPAPVQAKPRRVWTEAEARAFLAATEGRRFHLLWLLILTTGLRRGEALALRWVDLDLEGDDCVLRVRQTIELVGGHVRVGEPKTNAAKRTVELPDDLVAFLAHERERAQDRQRFSPDAVTLVFSTHDGLPLSPNNVYRAFQQDIALANVPRISLHDLRRTFATIASSRGVPLRELAAVLGHAKPSVTMDIYAQATREGGRAVVDRVGRALLG